MRSMTGYGRGECPAPDRNIIAEIRTVNHKYLDVSVRMPRELAALEDRIRALVSTRVYRGKAEVYINLEWHADAYRRPCVDLSLARYYFEALNSLAAELGIAPVSSIESLLSLPDVVKGRDVPDDPEIFWPYLSQAVSSALERVVAMREVEGAKLGADIMHRIGKIEQTILEIAGRSEVLVEESRAKLSRRIADVISDVRIDEARLAMEVAVLADRCDYTEEMVRFRSHIAQFSRTLSEEGSIGKKLDFIVQEMAREANTTGAKAQDAEVVAMVVNLKSELEKVREQVQNLE